MPRGLPGASRLAGTVARIRSLWRGLRRRRDVEAEMAEEFRLHIELRTEDLMRRGLPRAEARRRAHVEFGHVEAHREAARASRGLRLFDQLGLSWLDVKLGVRMLAKYPGLSLVSVIGMAVAIAIGASGFGFLHALVGPLPLDQGSRIVALQNADTRGAGSIERHSARDFLAWRGSLVSVRDLGAYAGDEAMLTVPGGRTTLVRIARMTASGFRLARIAPILGRPLLDADERPGAPPVLVISSGEWQSRFDADPGVIGRSIRLDSTTYTVVGVMPNGFRFPLNYRYWAPLHLDPETLGSGPGPTIYMFGRLADGVTIETAQAELSAVGPSSDDDPATRSFLHPQVLPYTWADVGLNSPARVWALRTFELALSLLLIVVSLNVAVLFYARTVSRTGEVAVRTALGASRRRVLAQLFAEALVVSLTAAGIGLGISELGFAWLRSFATQGVVTEMPFWIDLGVGPDVVVYAAGLAVLAAFIVGVLPALKATGQGVQASLQQLASRGSRTRLGRTWTALIILQVAVAVAVLPYAMYSGEHFVTSAMTRPGYPVGELVRATVSIDPMRATAPPEAAGPGAFAGGVADLLRAIDVDPKVASVAYAQTFPGDEPHQSLEVEGEEARSEVWLNHVGPHFLTAFGVAVLAGRGLDEGDAEVGSNGVLVDQVFVQKVLHGGPALGRRIRLADRKPRGNAGVVRARPWLEIVGVVRALAPPPAFEDAAPKVYAPLALSDAGTRLDIAIRMNRGADPAAFVARLRRLAHTVAPRLQINSRTAAVDEHQRRQGLLVLALVIVLVTGSVLLLSAAGMYAMMAFIVASRRREIGIRAALGAGPRRLITGIFRRASAQLGAGVVGGLSLATLLSVPLGNGMWFWTKAGLLLQLLVVAVMAVIGLLAVWVPARRGLAIQPTEALREE